MRRVGHEAENKFRELLTREYVLSIEKSHLDAALESFRSRRDELDRSTFAADKAALHGLEMNESPDNQMQLQNATGRLVELDCLVQDWADAIDRARHGERLRELLWSKHARNSERSAKGARR
jgi:hypothetical protein